MNQTETLAQLEGLKLGGMAEYYQSIIKLPYDKRPSLDVAIARMVEEERYYRDNMRTERLLRASKLRYNANIEDIECSSTRNLTKEKLSEIADCSFIRQAVNILISGMTGCGKSYLACALGNQACQLGFRTEYYNMNRFMELVGQAKLDGTFLKLLTHVEKVDLLILDDFALQPMNDNVRQALLQMLEDRYDKRSVIIISQLPVVKWYEYIAEPTFADAIMDRLVNNAINIELKGESMRKKRNK